MFIRKVKTSSGATAVQLAVRENRRDIVREHIGSARNDVELTLLLEIARQKMHADQLPLFPKEAYPPTRAVTVGAKSHYLYETLEKVYSQLGFEVLNDEIFMQLVIARLVEPTSKLDSLRVLELLGVSPPARNELYRALPTINLLNYRDKIADCCFAHVNPASLSLILYDVTTLYFESQKGDEFRKPGMSKERRLDPQIVVGLLVTREGFPLAIAEFEGNKAETKTVIPVVQEFAKKYNLANITVAADAGMLSSENLTAIEQAGLHYIVGSKLDKIPYDLDLIGQLEMKVNDGAILDLHKDFVLHGHRAKRRVIYQYREKRAKLDLKNIEEQVEKAKNIIAGKISPKKNRFLKVSRSSKTLNADLIQRYTTRAGWKGYVTDLPKDGKHQVSPLEIIHNYHQLFQVEKSFRMSKSDLRARPIYHHKLDSIRAHLTLVFAALAVARHIEGKTGVSIKRFIQILRQVVTSTIRINGKDVEIEPLVTKDVEKMIQSLLG